MLWFALHSLSMLLLAGGFGLLIGWLIWGRQWVALDQAQVSTSVVGPLQGIRTEPIDDEAPPTPRPRQPGTPDLLDQPAEPGPQPVEANAALPEPIEVDAVLAEPVEVDAVLAEPVEADAALPEPVEADSALPEPVEADAILTEPTEADRVEAEWVEADRAHTETVDVDLREDQPEVDAAEMDAVQAAPVDTALAETTDGEGVDSEGVDAEAEEIRGRTAEVAVVEGGAETVEDDAAAAGATVANPFRAEGLDTEPTGAEGLDAEPVMAGAVELGEPELVDAQPIEEEQGYAEAEPGDAELAEPEVVDAPPAEPELVDAPPAEPEVVDAPPAEAEVVDAAPAERALVLGGAVDQVPQLTPSGSQVSSGGKSTSFLDDDVVSAPEDAAEGPEDVVSAPEDATEGPEAAAEGPEDVVSAPEDAAEGPEDVVSAPEDAAEGPEDAAEGPEDAAEGPDAAAEGPEDVVSTPDDAAGATEAEDADDGGAAAGVPSAAGRSQLPTVPSALSLPLSGRLDDAELLDDLTRIEGITPVMARALAAEGLGSFFAVSNAHEDQLRRALRVNRIRSAPGIAFWAARAGELVQEEAAARATSSAPAPQPSPQPPAPEKVIDIRDAALAAGRSETAGTGTPADLEWLEAHREAVRAAQAEASAEQARVAAEYAARERAAAASAVPDRVARPVVITPSTGDDLERIEGVGPRIAEVLRAAGLTTYVAMAAAHDHELRAVLRTAGLREAPTLSTWSVQAALLLQGDPAGADTLARGLMVGRETS